MTKENILRLLESLRLPEDSKQDENAKVPDDINEMINDPNNYGDGVPFLIVDGNDETIITRTAKGINDGILNPFEIDWMSVTLYETSFTKELLDKIDSVYIMDVAQAIDDEELRHCREDGQFTQVSSDYYGQGQRNSTYSGIMDNWDNCPHNALAEDIANGIIDKRNKAEEFRKKQKLNQKKNSIIPSGLTISHASEYGKLLEENNNLKNNIKELEDEVQKAKELNQQYSEMESEQAFNARTNSPCFTSKQMGIFLYAIANLTEEKIPGKTTLGDIVQRIAGYSSKTVAQNMKGEFSESDKKAVADAIEKKMPKLAYKVRKL